jgi:hypothetical protein
VFSAGVSRPCIFRWSRLAPWPAKPPGQAGGLRPGIRKNRYPDPQRSRAGSTAFSPFFNNLLAEHSEDQFVREIMDAKGNGWNNGGHQCFSSCLSMHYPFLRARISLKYGCTPCSKDPPGKAQIHGSFVPNPKYELIDGAINNGRVYKVNKLILSQEN